MCIRDRKETIKPLDLEQVKDEPLTKEPPGRDAKCEDTKKEYLMAALEDQLKDLPEKQKREYVALILRNHDVFSKDKMDLGRTHVMKHTIELKDNSPSFTKQFRIPESHRAVLICPLKELAQTRGCVSF